MGHVSYSLAEKSAAYQITPMPRLCGLPHGRRFKAIAHAQRVEQAKQIYPDGVFHDAHLDRDLFITRTLAQQRDESARHGPPGLARQCPERRIRSVCLTVAGRSARSRAWRGQMFLYRL